MGAVKAPARKRGIVGNDAVLPLIDRVLGGEKQAFDEIVRQHEGYVYRTCIAITGNAEDAEEATQDAFIKAYRNLGRFRRDARFTTWLTRIAVNESLQCLRRRRGPVESLDAPVEGERGPVPRQLEDWHPNPEQLFAGAELKKLAEDAVLALPPAYRVVFLLRDVCEMNIEETARALELTTPAVKSRLLRARLMVRETLAGKLQLSPDLKTRFRRAGVEVGMLLQSLGERLRELTRPRGAKEQP